MQLTPQNLGDHGFELLDKVKHMEYKSFVQKLNWSNSKLYLIYNFCIGIAIVITVLFIVTSHEIYFFKIFYALLGVVLAIVLILVHEVIHYIMYMIYGAEKIQIKRYKGEEYLLTLADQFLVGKKEIIWIAIMPFIIITALCILSLFFMNDHMQILFSATILFHTTMCKEDFSIIHYFSTQQGEVKMYTDIETETTYFYKRLDSDPK